MYGDDLQRLHRSFDAFFTNFGHAFEFRLGQAVPISRCHSAVSSTGSQLTTTESSLCISHSSTPLEALLKDAATDHLTAKRQAKQVAETIQQIDAQLRTLQTSALPALSKEKLSQLLSECQRYSHQGSQAATSSADAVQSAAIVH